MIKDNIIEIQGKKINCLLDILKFFENITPCQKLFGYTNLFDEDNMNLNRFNDVLGTLYGEIEKSTDKRPIIIRWFNYKHSKKALSYSETIKFIKWEFPLCHPTYHEQLNNEMALALKNQGSTIFEEVLEIIKNNDFVVELL